MKFIYALFGLYLILFLGVCLMLFSQNILISHIKKDLVYLLQQDLLLNEIKNPKHESFPKIFE